MTTTPSLTRVYVKSIVYDRVKGAPNADSKLSMIGGTDVAEEKIVEALFAIIKNNKVLLPAQSGRAELSTIKLETIASQLRGKYKIDVSMEALTGQEFKNDNVDNMVTLVVENVRHQATNYDHKYSVALGHFVTC